MVYYHRDPIPEKVTLHGSAFTALNKDLNTATKEVLDEVSKTSKKDNPSVKFIVSWLEQLNAFYQETDQSSTTQMDKADYIKLLDAAKCLLLELKVKKYELFGANVLDSVSPKSLSHTAEICKKMKNAPGLQGPVDTIKTLLQVQLPGVNANIKFHVFDQEWKLDKAVRIETGRVKNPPQPREKHYDLFSAFAVAMGADAYYGEQVRKVALGALRKLHSDYPRGAKVTKLQMFEGQRITPEMIGFAMSFTAKEQQARYAPYTSYRQEELVLAVLALTYQVDVDLILKNDFIVRIKRTQALWNPDGSLAVKMTDETEQLENGKTRLKETYFQVY
jgi:hypothetical protein